MKDSPPLEYSGIFFDSPDLDLFTKWYRSGIIGGATLNPPSLRKGNVLNVEEHIEKMVQISHDKFPISIEIPDTDWPIVKMVQLGFRYHVKFPDNAVIKVPMDPNDPTKAFEVIRILGSEGVRTNATLGLTSGQLIGSAEAQRYSKAKGDNYISLFWGRREEAVHDLVENEKRLIQKQDEDKLRYYPADYVETMQQSLETGLIADASKTLLIAIKYLQNHGLNTRIIVGSIRRPYQIEEAFFLGADIVTVPPEILEEWMKTRRGEETVGEFNNAYRFIADNMTLIDGFTPPQ